MSAALNYSACKKFPNVNTLYCSMLFKYVVAFIDCEILCRYVFVVRYVWLLFIVNGEKCNFDHRSYCTKLPCLKG
jgi:hypothetical protein